VSWRHLWPLECRHDTLSRRSSVVKNLTFMWCGGVIHRTAFIPDDPPNDHGKRPSPREEGAREALPYVEVKGVNGLPLLGRNIFAEHVLTRTRARTHTHTYTHPPHAQTHTYTHTYTLVMSVNVHRVVVVCVLCWEREKIGRGARK